MTSQPRILHNHFTPIGMVLALVAAWVLACTPSTSDSSRVEPQPAEAVDKPAGQSLIWTDKRYSVFKGIPARAQYALPHGSNSKPEEINEGIRQIFSDIDSRFNSFNPKSEVATFNRNKIDGPIEVSDALLEAIGLARGVWQQSDGAFDITVWPFKIMWNDAVTSKTPPSDATRTQAAARVGFDKLSIDDARKTIGRNTPGVMLDFGGIIKGYGVDRICTYLKSKGAANALVQIGGEIRVFGHNPEGKTWTLGIQHPTDLEKLWGALTVPGEYGVSSSGNYRQPLTIGGITYYHIFDPASGQPIPTRILGVTVVVRDGNWPNATADAWATALAVSGVEKGLKLAQSHGIDALFLVETEGGKPEAIMTDGLKVYLHTQ